MPIDQIHAESLVKSVTEISTFLKALRDDVLPPIALDARKSSDSVIKLESWADNINNRIKNIEDGKFLHNCQQINSIEDHKNKLENHSKLITQNEKDTSGLSKWRTYLGAILIPLVLFSLGVAYTAVTDVATATAERRAYQQTSDRHENNIRELELARNRDTQTLIKMVQAVTHRIQTISNIQDDRLSVDEIRLKLDSRSKQRFESLLHDSNSKLNHEDHEDLP